MVIGITRDWGHYVDIYSLYYPSGRDLKRRLSQGRGPADDPKEREATILAIFGSPDKRQIDGLGGADPLTSKVVFGAPRRPGGGN